MTTSPIPHIALLARHPGTETDAVSGIEARVCWNEGGGLAFTYLVKGDLSRLRIPPPGETRRADRLWERTCFEAFVSMKDHPDYYEINVAPSCEWAIYAFADYRAPAPPSPEILSPKITVHSAEEYLLLDAIVGIESLPAIEGGTRLRVALTAVIEDISGTLSYWALTHPPGRPDFHHPDGFILELEPLEHDAPMETQTGKR